MRILEAINSGKPFTCKPMRDGNVERFLIADTTSIDLVKITYYDNDGETGDWLRNYNISLNDLTCNNKKASVTYNRNGWTKLSTSQKKIFNNLKLEDKS